MPNEEQEHEMAPEEENRACFAHPKMREQIVDLLARYDTLEHTLIISLYVPPSSHALTNTISMPSCSKQR